jgi:hypothetical protein
MRISEVTPSIRQASTPLSKANEVGHLTLSASARSASPAGQGGRAPKGCSPCPSFTVVARDRLMNSHNIIKPECENLIHPALDIIEILANLGFKKISRPLLVATFYEPSDVKPPTDFLRSPRTARTAIGSRPTPIGPARRLRGGGPRGVARRSATGVVVLR